MHYEAATTSPTELLAPEVFPEDITDMNGNAMREKRNTNLEFHEGRSFSCNVRCLLLLLLFFITATLVLVALFTWKMVEEPNVETERVSKPECHERTKPVRFTTTPKTIQDYMDSWESEIKSSLERDKVSVASVNVVYYDKIIWQAKYTWNQKTKKAEKEKTEKLFPTASVTKVITALLAFKLENDGDIDLDDPVVKYEPDFRVINPFNNDNGTEITVRQLISYSSGLPREAPCYPENKTSYCPYDNANVIEKLRKNRIRLRFPPGSDALYGNLPFAVAGNAISRNYSGGFTKQVHDKIFKPFNMNSSAFTFTGSAEDNIYAPTAVNGDIPPFKYWGWLDPAGGLLTTVNDLAQLEIALFNNNNTGFMRSAILDDFFTPAYFFPDERQMLGNGWDIGFHKGYLNYTKEGYVYGYGSMISLIPELRLAVNVLSTSNLVYNMISKIKMPKLFSMFHEELAKQPQNNDINPVHNPEMFVGDYSSEVITLRGQIIRISTSKNKKANDKQHYLLLTLTDHDFPLTYIGDYIFEMIQQDVCTNFFFGVNGERVYFTKPKNPNEKVQEFVIYGIHLRGKATFRRKS